MLCSKAPELKQRSFRSMRFFISGPWGKEKSQPMFNFIPDELSSRCKLVWQL